MTVSARGFRAAATAACLLALAWAAGCRSVHVQHEALEFADGYYATLRDHGLDAAMPLYAADFFDRTPRETWRASRALVDTVLGPIRDFRMDKWTIEMLPNGTFVTFEYDVTYERGTSRDTLTVVLPRGAQRFQVYGHAVHSGALDAYRRPSPG